MNTNEAVITDLESIIITLIKDQRRLICLLDQFADVTAEEERLENVEKRFSDSWDTIEK